MLQRMIKFYVLVIVQAFIVGQLTAQDWQSAAEMQAARFNHSSVLLPDGRILIAGGTQDFLTPMATCEIFDYQTNTVTPAASMNDARFMFSMVLLDNGLVLAAGGRIDERTTLNNCELYDPATDTWIPTGALNYSRIEFPLIKLDDGSVIAIGGLGGPDFETTNRCEIYDPVTGQWSEATPIDGKERNSHRALMLPTDKILVTNGYSTRGGYWPECELYDPATGSWSKTGSFTERPSGQHSLTLLDDGDVLLAGGWAGPQWRCELYKSDIGEWIPTSPLAQNRYAHEAIKLNDGRVIVIGGLDSETSDGRTSFSIDGTEIYDPFAGTWSNGDPYPQDVFGHNALLLPNGQVVVIGGTSVQSLVYDPSAAITVSRFINAQNGGMISGTVWIDADNNCEIAAAEIRRPGSLIRITPGPIFTTADEEGRFEAFLEPGDYSVEPIQEEFWDINCPASTSSYDITVGAAGDIFDDLNFGLEAANLVQQLDISVVAGRARPGFPVYYTIRYKNSGTVPFTGVLTFEADEKLEYVSSDPPTDEIENNELEWDIVNVPVGGTGQIIVVFKLPPNVELLGEEICSEITAEPTDAGEELLTDSDDDFCQIITGSFDPNDIRVMPAGLQPGGRIYPEDDELTYIIRFQNTGTDTAFTVTVIDTLDADLDPATVKIGAASHDFTLTISGSGILAWRFDNIMLPDSNVNEPLSHGVLKYTVKIREDAPIGTEISNRAAIYFDFNPPVITNTVRNVVVLPPSDVDEVIAERSIRLFPNPARDRLTLEPGVFTTGVVSLRDALGRHVAQWPLQRVERQELDISHIPAGVYFLTASSTEGVRTQRVVIAR